LGDASGDVPDRVLALYNRVGWRPHLESQPDIAHTQAHVRIVVKVSDMAMKGQHVTGILL
jgi:hypothetical protein